MCLYYKFILLISFFVTRIVSSAVIQEVFTSNIPSETFEIVEVVKIHRDKSVPCGFVIDEVEFVLIDYTKPMPKILAPVDPSLKYLDDYDGYDDEPGDKKIENFSEDDRDLEL